MRLLKDELLIIVGTSSSETVLPRLLRKLNKAGASKQTVGVVLPTGYSFNLDGTCIYLTLGALFITQAAGQDMCDRRADRAVRADGADLQGRRRHHRRRPGDADRLAAGVRRRRSSRPSRSRSGIALVVGIDRIMSEGRALTNCIGNGVATMVIAKLPGRA